jgi:hypothetical protein
MLHIRRHTRSGNLGWVRRGRCCSSPDTQDVGLCHTAVEGADLLETSIKCVSMPLSSVSNVECWKDLLAQIVALLLGLNFFLKAGKTSTAHHAAISDYTQTQTQTIDIAIAP